MKQRFLLVVVGVLLVLGWIETGEAQVPSSAQLEMLRNLPPEQQRTLARQYGIELPDLSNTQVGQEIDLPPTIGKRLSEQQLRKEQVAILKELQATEDWQLEEEEREPFDLAPYGYDIFSGAPTSFSPLADLPVPDNYIIGPGDEIRVQLYGKDNESYQFTVGRDGQIDFPKLGPVSVAGQHFSDLKKSLRSEIKRKMIGVEAYISLGELKSIPVFVLGDAYQPGAYTLSSLSTVSQALMAAGGVDSIGSLRNIRLKRRGKIVAVLDLYDFLLEGDTSHDLRLRAGDTIFIPAKGGEVYIDGQVRRPAIYELQKNQSIQAVLEIAGGLLASGYQHNVSVERYTAGGTEMYNLNLTVPAHRNFVIRNGDKIMVKENARRMSNTVELLGDVQYPGHTKWQAGMRISDLMSNLREDLRETTDLDYALVVREMNVRGDITTLQFNLGRAITRPNTKDNLELKANDQVLVFSREVKVLEEDEDTDLEGGSRNGVEANLDKATDFLSRQPFNANKFDIQSGQEPDMEEWLAFYQEQSKSEEDEEDNFSRELLLKPVIAKLQSQASVTNPVQLIEIDGAVHFPGTYPLTQNARLTDLIQAGGGLKEFAHISKAELSRIALSKKRHIEHLSVDLERAVKGDRKHNISLLSKDRLLVFAQEAWTEDYSITLEGEVTFPGVYSVNRGDTLADVIERAGGMSDFAYPQGAIFTRVDLKEKEEQELGQLRDQLKQEIASLSLRPGLRISSSPTEALGVINELADLEALGRMVIDLESILTGDKSRDVLLEDGDRLFVPPIRKTVTVIGQVQSPSTHFFDQNIDVDQYIRLAGGTKRQADYERIYVVHANGSVSLPERGRWFSRDKQVVLKPADTIVVPLDTDYSDNLNTWATVTQIMSQLGIAWAAIKN